jgi:hypothetical protein
MGCTWTGPIGATCPSPGRSQQPKEPLFVRCFRGEVGWVVCRIESLGFRRPPRAREGSPRGSAGVAGVVGGSPPAHGERTVCLNEAVPEIRVAMPQLARCRRCEQTAVPRQGGLCPRCQESEDPGAISHAVTVRVTDCGTDAGAGTGACGVVGAAVGVGTADDALAGADELPQPESTPTPTSSTATRAVSFAFTVSRCGGRCCADAS